MGLRLRRNLGPVSHLQPGEYTVATRDELPEIRCSGCGGISALDMTTYEVFRDGTVAPVWMCPFASCSTIEYLRLEAWGEAVLA